MDLGKAREQGYYYREEKPPLIRRGTFKCSYNHEAVFLLITLGLIVATLIFLLPMLTAVNELAYNGDISRKTNRGVYMAVFIAMEFIFGTIFALILAGRRYEYRAEETEFVIKGPGGKTEYFYYSDVQDITAEPIKLLFKHRGYRVRITTSIRTVEYRIVFGENKVFTELNGTPFYYLGVNSGIFAVDKSSMDTELAESIFESMVVEQITRKSYEALDEGLKGSEHKRW